MARAPRIRPAEAASGRLGTPPALVRASTNNVRPLFSLAEMAPHYSVEHCDARPLASLARLLRTLAQMTWAEIQSSGRRQLGHEIIRRDELRPGIGAHVPGDRVALAFRAGDDYRVIGYRTDDVLYVVAVDSDLTAYEH
jgi:hypothetical protein